MLSLADAALVRQETALPGVGLLFDGEAFVTALKEARPDAGLLDARPSYVRYKPGTSCLVLYRATTPVGETFLYAVAYADHTRVKLAKARRSTAAAPLSMGGSLALDEWLAAVYAFPCDRRLKRLDRVVHGEDDRDGSERARFLQRLIPYLAATATLTPLRYKPERRFVARVDGEGDAALLKMYTQPGYAAASRNACAFVSGRRLRTPILQGRSRRHAAMALEWLPGQAFDRLLQGTACDLQVVRSVGQALAELHGQTPRLCCRYDGEEARLSLTAAARAVVAIVPHLAPRVFDLAAYLIAGLGRTPGAIGAIHGDFSPDQALLMADGQVALLDFDRAGYGEQARDLGGFIACLRQWGVEGALSPARADAFTHAFLDGYRVGTRERTDPARIRLHTAAGLLRLACDGFRHRRTANWRAYAETMIHLAEEAIHHAHYDPIGV